MEAHKAFKRWTYIKHSVIIVRFPIPDYLDKLPDDIRVKGAEGVIRDILSERKVSLSEIARKVGTPYRVYFRYMNEGRAMPLKILRVTLEAVSEDKQDYDSMMRAIYKQKLVLKTLASNSSEVRLPRHYDERLCYLLGLLHDGTVYIDDRKSQYVVQFWQGTDKALMEVAADHLCAVFGTRPQEYSKYIQLSSKAVAYFLRLVCGIPERHREWNSFLIEGLPWQLQKYQIAGFYDAEGWCGGKDDPRVKLSQKNPKKLAEIRSLLGRHGIKCGGVIREREVYALYVSGLNSCVRLAKEIARISRHSKKRAKLEELLECVERPPLTRGT